MIRLSFPNPLSELQTILEQSPKVTVPQSRVQLLELSLGGNPEQDRYEVSYDVPGRGTVVEAEVVRCKNGAVVNYTDAYMRRRDPDCMVIGDSGESDKARYEERFGVPFDDVRRSTLDWLKGQELIAMPFMAGDPELGYAAMLIVPANAAFFAAGLADLQGFIPEKDVPKDFQPRLIVYVAPPFRHTHYDGKQVVVHNRLNSAYELFSYNLYPGPSAKKGVYSFLLTMGEKEGWVTAHASTVRVITPYDNIITFMHEGASGGGKSEMLERAHREPDGRLLLGENQVTGECYHLQLTQTCDLQPVTDDMALCHPSYRMRSRKLVVKDAERGWFLRINHIDHYGVDPQYEHLCTHPEEPLVFLNLYGVPGATCLIWEHQEDSPGQRCPNPRVILPRRMVPDTYNEPVEVDVRSFGVRTPPCTREKPSYGIIGLFHLLPPSLAWLWRLVAPRGFSNPSIIDTEGLSSEGVGSYWPFATGRFVDQANLLLRQIIDTPRTDFILLPNQHIGAWKVGFMPQWITREYLAPRGSARFRPEQIVPSRCSLLGYTLNYLKVDGNQVPREFLQVNKQPEVGDAGYDAGALLLREFFARELDKYLTADLDPLGREIIGCCLDGGSLEDYERLAAV